jgi:hypothetical protein
VTHLARFVTSSEWADFAGSIETGTLIEPHLECPVRVLQDVLETKNDLSFWDLGPDHRDLDRVVAAYCAGRKKLEGVKLRWVDNAEVQRLGIGAKKTAARDCPDEHIAKSAHWDLSARDVGKAARLAVALASTESIERTERRVAQCIIESIRQGRFGWGVLKSELVHQLFKDGHVKADLSPLGMA